MQNQCIVYFNGYKGVESEKYSHIKEYFEPQNIQTISYDQLFDINSDSENLQKLVEKYTSKNLKFIASSLGSIPAMYFSIIYKIPTALINPSYFPEVTLKNIASEKELLAMAVYKEKLDCLSIMDKLFFVYVAKNDERISQEHRDLFFKRWENYIHYYNESDEGGHSYKILKSKLKSIYVSLFVNNDEKKMDIDDYFQMM
jgi:predicted esterase YcpF (UPF0227 family)